MTDRARRIGDELRVCREEAIFYLEGLDWDLDAAMEACRSKTLNLPSLAVEPPPEKEKSSRSEVQSPLPSTTTGSQSRNELIVQFINFAVGSDVQDATSYLERNDWDLDRAVLQFCDERRPTPSQRKVNRKLGRLNSQQYSQDDETSAAVGTLVELIREEQVPKAIPPMVSSHMKLTNAPEEQLSQWKEESIKSFFKVDIERLETLPLLASVIASGIKKTPSVISLEITQKLYVTFSLACVFLMAGLSLNCPSQC
ncbi:hypothetical protein Bca52824_048836 [Brassica carinata]|uniref:UBA domain-containing protein n=1 Tax=Brassica carinata TaxID=52824 RepID=A0A8X7USI5_BRACI|nr:hypothetical protein Bca52824_048836 [Brassica carinata]